ncbi:MATE family efflux transporter [Sphaerisporangium fuscum]|uniref:MATE family efflux transporter n=1 Tax=Sphaerisporangium fuscum TaxID=2835868 RepID=UPI001BDC4988|nr:MATE family efflux transporter [Sphaerisporangium fuscum]
MRLIRLALPVYVELLTAVVAVSLIDTLWVSGLGSAAVAAVTIAATTEYLALGVMLAVQTGTTVLIGRRDGHQPLGPLIRTSWLLWGAVSVAVAVPGVLLRDDLARLFAEDATTASLASGFYAISLGGLPVFFAQCLVDGIFKGLGDTRTPMRTALLCNALVIGLDPLFIYGLGLGVRGAALATLVARLLTLMVAAVILLRRLPRTAEPAGIRSGSPRAETAAILRTGLPMSGDFLARSIVGMVLVGLVGTYGVAAQAGYGIGMKIMLAGVMVFYALRQATMIETARTGATTPAGALRLGLAAGVAAAVVLNVAAAPVIGWFTADPAVAGEAVWFLRCMTAYLVPFGGLIALGGVLQASARGGRLLAATLAGFAVQLPLAYGLSAWLSVTGVWLSMSAGTVVALALACLLGLDGLRTGRPASPGRPAAGRGPSLAPEPRSTRTAEAPQCGP